MNINGRPLPGNPISALNELAFAKYIAQPVYTGAVGNGEYHVVVEVDGYGHVVATANTRQNAKRKAAQGLLDLVLPKICPTVGRRRYATWESAYDAMLEQQAVGKGKPLKQVYACRCDWWHISGATPREWDTPTRKRDL